MWLKQKGFTIVELLVTIVAIAILVTITYVSYGSIQSQSNDSAIKVDVGNFGRKIMDYYNKNGSYPDTAAELISIKMNRTTSAYADNNWSIQYCNSPTDFAIGAESKSGNAYYYSSKTGSIAKRVGNRASDWCTNNYSIPFTYSAWASPSEDWSGSRSSNGL